MWKFKSLPNLYRVKVILDIESYSKIYDFQISKIIWNEMIFYHLNLDMIYDEMK